ncbi:MAG TPA: hypothetical protein VNE39_17600 [Planctomycetota bacterium]|nr:hypothetical protein [Planctomycetota bacterium]
MRSRVLALIAVCVAMVLVAGQAMAREKGGAPKVPKPKPIMGTVAVTKDADTIKSITITSGKKDAPVVYCVVLDDNGKKVAELDGKKVKATGTVEEKDGNKWLTVATCEELVKKPPKKKDGN